MNVNGLAPREQRAVDSLLRQFAKKDGPNDFESPEALAFQLKFGDKVMELKRKDLDEATLHSLGKLKESTEQLEGVMVKQLLEVMSKSKPKGEDDGPMSDMAQDMMHQSMADNVGRTGQFGVGKSMFQQLSRPLLNERLAQVYINQQQAKK